MTGLCECGCGELAPVATGNVTRLGWIKGQPIRFIHGHNGNKRHVLRREGDCFVSAVKKTAKGYGRTLCRGEHEQEHRLAYELARGPVPDGHQIHHTCENPGCVNPDHLVALTPVAHVRLHAKLSEADAREIKRLLAHGARGVDVARTFSISQQEVCNIRKGRCWADV